MKKNAFFCLCAALLLTACSVSPSFLSGSGADRPAARTSLDYEGRYEVRHRVNDDDVRMVQLKNDGAYRVILANGIHVTGNFSWDDSGNRVVLEKDGEPVWTFGVGKGFLKLLDPGRQQNWIFQKFGN